MSATSIWDDPAVKPQNSQYASWNAVGTKVEGTIDTLTAHTFINQKTGEKSTHPKITFVEPDVPTITASQAMLKQHLFEVRPEIGEKLYVEFTRETPAGAGKMKHFTVRVTGTDGKIRVAGDGPGF